MLYRQNPAELSSVECLKEEKEAAVAKTSVLKDAIDERGDHAPAGVEFVPFSVEVGGVWGPAARNFFRESIALAHDACDIDLYHLV